ncbi:signal peptide protein [Oribacterium sp. oral taxon 102]|uniref:hypothetical protein n=1 Tax=Oribacterium sp. oral taxon 102 TaxID=671214 RepID=UPI0015C0E3C9|nr:hypothetical protein [Oribacterium sp. oral taxon 102]NWO20386.1 signal peptide protein [Oribacterium sp. oral taxon 102]
MRRAGKKSLIGGLLALSLILTGTGYAYWTDTLHVTTKATTGDFGVTFVDLGLYAQYDNETLQGGWSIVDGIGDSGYVDDHFFMRGTSDYNKIAKDGSIDAYKVRQKGYNNIDFDAELEDAELIPRTIGPYNKATTLGSDTIKLEINEMYPGYAQAFRADLLNVGSIAAKLSTMKFTVEGVDNTFVANDTVKNMLGIALYMHQELIPGSSAEPSVFKLTKALSQNDEDYFTVGKVHFMRLSALEKLDPAVVKAAIENATILCSPTENRMDVLIGVAMDPDATGKYTTGTTELMADNKDADSQKKGASVTIDFLWDQFNEGKDAGNPNYLVYQNK